VHFSSIKSLRCFFFSDKQRWRTFFQSGWAQAKAEYRQAYSNFRYTEHTATCFNLICIEASMYNRRRRFNIYQGQLQKLSYQLVSHIQFHAMVINTSSVVNCNRRTIYFQITKGPCSKSKYHTTIFKKPTDEIGFTK